MLTVGAGAALTWSGKPHGRPWGPLGLAVALGGGFGEVVVGCWVRISGGGRGRDGVASQTLRRLPSRTSQSRPHSAQSTCAARGWCGSHSGPPTMTLEKKREKSKHKENSREKGEKPTHTPIR